MTRVAIYPAHGHGKLLSDFISAYSPELEGIVDIPEPGSSKSTSLKQSHTLVLATKKDSSSLKEKFKGDGWATVIDYIEFLDKFEPSKITNLCKKLIGSKPSITFKIPSNFKNVYGNIPDILIDRGINVILLLGDERSQKQFNPACKAVTEMHPFFEYYLLKYSKLFIADDTSIKHDFCESRKTPKTIHFLHATNTIEAFIDMQHGDEYVSSYYNKQIIPFFDYFFLPTKSYLGVYHSCIERIQDKRRRWMVPTGSISLDRAIKEQKACRAPKPKDSILFIPTAWDESSSFYSQEYQSLPSRGFEIVKTLLNEFPNKRVILRPHPNAILFKGHKEVLNKINSAFHSQQRYVYDTASSYKESFERSALSISDCSSSAFTFSLSTSRPSITFQNVRRSPEHTIMGNTYESQRRKLGPVVNDLKSLVSETASCLDNPVQYKSSILKLRQDHYFNAGSVEENIASCLFDLLNEKENRDFIEVSKN